MKYLVEKGGEVLTGFDSKDEALEYARKMNAFVIENHD